MNIATDKAFPFTEARIEEAIRLIAAGKVETDNEGRRLWRDSGDTHGLYLRASASGGTYYRISKKAGRKQKKRIGDALTMRVSTARAEALKLASGDNSAGAAPIRVRTDGPTVAQAWSRYIADTKSGDFIAGRKRTAASTIASYEDLYAPHLSKQYGNKSLHALAKDVHSIHRRLRDKPATANRLLQVISNLFVHAARAGYWDKPNPTLDPITGRTIRKYEVKPRSRWLTTAEASRVMAYAATEIDPWSDFWPLMILTGVRVSNLREMKWSQLDLREQNSTWTIPHTKNGDPHIVSLDQQAVRILRARHNRAVSAQRSGTNASTEKRRTKLASQWVFPMRDDPERCISDCDHAWERVRQHAPLDGVRIHDLRRTAASWATQAGMPLPAVGDFIGDKSINATAVYARADIAAKRQVAKVVADRLAEAVQMARSQRKPK